MQKDLGVRSSTLCGCVEPALERLKLRLPGRMARLRAGLIFAANGDIVGWKAAEPRRNVTRDVVQLRPEVPDSREEPPLYDLIELLFFAYRDFVGDADRLLETYGFGRAHHRVLHFVSRKPGLTVAELLDILRITKQSLARVMKDLLEAGFVTAHAGAADRRQRLLFVTPTGRELADSLARLQSERFRRALHELPSDAREGAIRFLFALVDRDARADVAATVWPEPTRRPQAGRP